MKLKNRDPMLSGRNVLYMTKTFYDLGDTANAKGLLVMVGANLAMQGLIVYGQTQGLKKNKWSTMLFDMRRLCPS